MIYYNKLFFPSTCIDCTNVNYPLSTVEQKCGEE